MKMKNHPNRGRIGPSTSPSPEEVRAARIEAGLTQTQAAKIVHCTLNAWQKWEAAGVNSRRFHPGLWELFKIKTGLVR